MLAAMTFLLGASARVTGLPALLIILVILAIPIGLGILIGRSLRSKRNARG